MSEQKITDSLTYYQYQGERIGVALETTEYRILGEVFIHKNQRFSDSLNRNRKNFLVVTDAKVFPLKGERPLFKREHLMINKSFIVSAWENPVYNAQSEVKSA